VPGLLGGLRLPGSRFDQSLASRGEAAMKRDPKDKGKERKEGKDNKAKPGEARPANEKPTEKTGRNEKPGGKKQSLYSELKGELNL
jgi:hypothetical protein